MKRRGALPPPQPRSLNLASQRRRNITRTAWWPWLKRGGTTVFFALVAYLLFSQARSIEWDKVLSSLQHYPLAAAGGAAALALASFVLYSCFDLLGRRYTGHQLGTATVMATTFVSYAFNLNLGSVVGGVALRYRLYSRLGLDSGVITRVMTLSMLSNWMGYIVLAGLVFSLQPPVLPVNWAITVGNLRLIGLALLAAALAYLAACAFSRRRTLWLRGHEIELPSIRMAGLQLLMGASNWLIMSGIIFVLLQQRIEFSAVVGTLLLAAIAGVITHVPAGLGVLEAVFVALLSHQLPRYELLAALIAYRMIYYFTPLAVASVIYLVIEGGATRLGQPVRPAQ